MPHTQLRVEGRTCTATHLPNGRLITPGRGTAPCAPEQAFVFFPFLADFLLLSSRA